MSNYPPFTHPLCVIKLIGRVKSGPSGSLPL